MGKPVPLPHRKVPYLLSEKRPPGGFRNRLHLAISPQLKAGIAPAGMQVHKQVIVTPLHMQELVKAFLVNEQRFPISKVTPYPHVGISEPPQSKILYRR